MIRRALRSSIGRLWKSQAECAPKPSCAKTGRYNDLLIVTLFLLCLITFLTQRTAAKSRGLVRNEKIIFQISAGTSINISEAV